MAISRLGNTIIVPQADSGIALAAGMHGEVVGVELKTAAAVASMRVYSGTAIDATKKIAEIGDVAINNSGYGSPNKREFRDGIYVDITGAGAVGYVHLR